MKISENKFNTIFNIFIIVGMLCAVGLVEYKDINEHNGQIIKQLVIAIGAVMGVLNTVMSANGNIWNFLFGIIEVSICAYANYDSGNLGLFYQHIFYFLPMQFIGLWQWRKRGAGTHKDGKNKKVEARKLQGKQWCIVGICFFVGTIITYFILYYLNTYHFDTQTINSLDQYKIWLDASLVVLNIIGQILMSFAFVEQWYIWTLVNIFSILLWTNRLLAPGAESYTIVMLIKYIFYLLNSINGIRIWLKLAKQHKHIENMPNHCC